jgi:hypothetical protein
MSGSVDDHRSVLFVDLIDDPEVPPTSGEQAIELAAERLACTLRILSDRTQDRLDDGGLDLLWQLAEVTEPFGCDLDLASHL